MIIMQFDFIRDCLLRVSHQNGTERVVRRLNATHQIGCATAAGSSIGVVRLVRSQSDIECLEDIVEDCIVAMPLSFFTTENMVLLRDSGRVNGVIVLKSPQDHAPPRFSEASSCPNEDIGLYTKSDNARFAHCKMGRWNPPNPALSLMYEDWKMPIFLITNQTDIDYIVDHCYENFNGPNSGSTDSSPKCAAQLKLNMYAAKDTPTCMRRSSFANEISPVRYCEPLGDWNLVGMLFAVNKSECIESRSLLVVGTRMDAASLFYNIVPGAHTAVTGLVTFLTAAYTLAYLREDIQKKIQAPFSNVLFIIFNGEAFDYIGSSRIVYDMKRGVFPVSLNPDIRDQPAPIRLRHISHFIEISQMGINNGTFYVHSDPVSSSDAIIFEKIESMVDALKQVSHKSKVERAPSGHPLPPSSLQMFLQEDPNIAGAVLADHSGSYINPYYNSFLDTRSGLENELPEKLADVATTISKAIYLLLTGLERMDIKVNVSIINELLTCFLDNNNCPIMKEIQGDRQCRKNHEPYSLYIGVGANRRRVNAATFLTRHIFAYLFGDVLGGVAREECNNNGSQLYSLDWIQGANSRGFCSRSTVTYTVAISPAFSQPTWNSTRYSTWTESVWTEPVLRIFLRPSRYQEIFALITGNIILFLSFCMTEFVHKNYANLFVFYEREETGNERKETDNERSDKTPPCDGNFRTDRRATRAKIHATGSGLPERHPRDSRRPHRRYVSEQPDATEESPPAMPYPCTRKQATRHGPSVPTTRSTRMEAVQMTRFPFQSRGQCKRSRSGPTDIPSQPHQAEDATMETFRD
ncbi:NCSTN [Cordylochernes scorpioides]|uniref:Nicastrin n=1 Tax=Cordylochernes scorpioides TaxID=51811 RepID=A0ABY6KAW6_9ARAC|nr:NCSTN [Cordylochernes scorpioides]